MPTSGTKKTISSALHLSLAHLEEKNTFVQMLFLDFSSAIPSFHNIWQTNWDPCHHCQDRLPQGCVLSHVLFTLMTCDCMPSSATNHIVRFADDTTVVGLMGMTMTWPTERRWSSWWVGAETTA